MSAQVAFDRYLTDTLMRDLVGHDRRPSAFLVYLALAAAERSGAAMFSHSELAERTGLSRRSVQAALDHLKRRQLVIQLRKGPTDVARYYTQRPWRR